MNTRIQTIQTMACCVALTGMVFALPQAMAAGNNKQSPAQISGDQFQLSISSVPYSTDPNSEYVRIYCAPGGKHKKPRYKTSSKKKN